LFEDIDPAAVHEEYVHTFFGTSVSGVFVYPEESIEPEPETLTVLDSMGSEVIVNLPVEKIVCLNPGLIELVFALGGEDKIVGRSEGCTFPDSVSEIPIVAGSSYTPNLEMILELEPDFIFADTMLSYKTEELETIRAAGIPVVMESASNFTRMPDIMGYLGQILDNTEKATEILEFMDCYEELVIERVANLTESEKPQVFLEWSSTEWKTFAEGSSTHDIIVKAGGINIAPNDSGSSPTLSPEYVAEQDPDVIIRMSSSGNNLTGMQSFREAMLIRAGLSGTTAVAEDRVYLYDSIVFQGLRYPVGLLYWAKWFNPSMFADIDPGAVHEELIQEFFDEELEGTYAYPEIVTVVDAIGNEVTITFPLERIVSLTGGLTEIVCALGGEDLIVGRGQYSTFPPSVMDIPVASSSSYSVNMETLLEFEPDLILADTMMSSKPEYIEQIQVAGIPLIIENTANISRITPIITSLGVIVNNKEKATELVDWINYYVDLVTNRTATLSSSDTPSVYIEWTSSWSAIGPAHAIGEIMATAGGINIVTNASATTTTVSSEFVLTENPDFMFATTYSMPAPTDIAFYEDKMADVLSQTGISSTTAAANNNIHLFSYRIIQGIRYPIGLLYFAKCMHPTLYEDINPDAILDDMIDQFFGIEIDSIFMYP
jgi:iron complex transport system substrate-binding protein